MKDINSFDCQSLEKCAISRMSKMTFENLMNVLQEYNNMHMITEGNPLYYYLSNYHPFYPKKLHINQRKLFEQKHKNIKNIVNFVHTQRMKKIKNLRMNKLKEMPITFTRYNKYNYYFQMFQNIEKFDRNSKKIKIIIIIQKNVRCYLKRVQVLRVITHIIVTKIIKSILLMQKNFRGFYQRKKFRINQIIKKILKERITKLNKIKRLMKNYQNKIYIRKYLLLQNILYDRLQKICFIQGFIKTKKFNKKIKKLMNLEKNVYVISYPFEANSASIKIYLDKKLTHFKKFDFKFCPFRKCLVCYIGYNELKREQYYTNLIIDGNRIIDSRFKTAELRDGIICNIINFNKINHKNLELNKLNNSLINFSLASLKSTQESLISNNYNQRNNNNMIYNNLYGGDFSDNSFFNSKNSLNENVDYNNNNNNKNDINNYHNTYLNGGLFGNNNNNDEYKFNDMNLYNFNNNNNNFEQSYENNDDINENNNMNDYNDNDNDNNNNNNNLIFDYVKKYSEKKEKEKKKKNKNDKFKNNHNKYNNFNYLYTLDNNNNNNNNNYNNYNNDFNFYNMNNINNINTIENYNDEINLSSFIPKIKNKKNSPSHYLSNRYNLTNKYKEDHNTERNNKNNNSFSLISSNKKKEDDFFFKLKQSLTGKPNELSNVD